MAAEFHRRTLHVLARHAGEQFAHGRGAGESNFANHRMRNQVTRNFRRAAVHQIDHARRYAGIGERAHQFRRRRGRFFGRFEYDRTAGGQRRRQLAYRLIDGEIPRRKGGHRADRFFHHQLVHAFGPRGYHAPVRATAFFGEPLDDVAARQHFELGFAHRLALFQRHQLGDFVGACTQNIRRLAHDFAALEGGNFAPDFVAFVRGFERTVKVGFFRVSNGADLGMCGGVDHGQGAAGGGGAPYAVDEKLGILIGGHGDRLLNG